MATALKFPATTVAAGSSVQTVIPANSRTGVTVDLGLTGAGLTGTWKFEVSNSGNQYLDLTASLSPAVSQPTGLTGANTNFVFINPAIFGIWSLLRITFTATVGTATGINGAAELKDF